MYTNFIVPIDIKIIDWLVYFIYLNIESCVLCKSKLYDTWIRITSIFIMHNGIFE